MRRNSLVFVPKVAAWTEEVQKCLTCYEEPFTDLSDRVSLCPGIIFTASPPHARSSQANVALLSIMSAHGGNKYIWFL